MDAAALRARLRLMAVADCGADDARIRAWAAGGVTALQLRDKTAAPERVLARARELAALSRALGLLFVINDRADWAALVGADGAHVGQADAPARARRLLGPAAVLGISVTAPDQAAAALAWGADYLGAGPVFPTGSKSDAAPALGLDGLRAVRTAAPEAVIVGIGGLGPDNARAARDAGADGVAVISALAGDDPRTAAAALAAALAGRKG